MEGKGVRKRAAQVERRSSNTNREHPVSNDEVIFDSRGKPIILSQHQAFASLGAATRKLKFKKQFFVDPNVRIDAEGTASQARASSERLGNLRAGLSKQTSPAQPLDGRRLLRDGAGPSAVDETRSGEVTLRELGDASHRSAKRLQNASASAKTAAPVTNPPLKGLSNLSILKVQPKRPSLLKATRTASSTAGLSESMSQRDQPPPSHRQQRLP